MTRPMMCVKANGQGVLSRRSFLGSTAAAAGMGMLGWKRAIADEADALRRRGLSCILLWMGGGPSQFESFDPKPGVPTGGPTKTIETAVPGIHIAQGWEQIAKTMQDLALIRSVTHEEGEHERASYQLHTGYVPTPSVKHPTFGSLVTHEIAPPEGDLPHFVRVGSHTPGVGPGFLGVGAAAFNVSNPLAMPKNILLPGGVSADRFGRRLELVRELSEDFADAGGAPLVASREKLHERAGRMVKSKDLEVFDLAKESEAMRDRYGRNSFGQGCLLARRLIERGVTFVEVVSSHPDAPAGWDTHIDNFTVTSKLVSWVDPGFAALLGDLKERGLLEKTLVIWMGEFGRTPKINDRGETGGRDHYARAYSAAVAGCGVQGGRVIGATDAQGATVTERPVTVPDLFTTFCHALKIDPAKENVAPSELPVRVAAGGEVVKELF